MNSANGGNFPTYLAESDKIVNKDADLPKFSLEKKETSQNLITIKKLIHI